MGAHRTCVRYSKVISTKRGVSELRCSKYVNKKGKAKCQPGLKGGARSRGLIHPATCGAPHRRKAK